MINQIQKDSPGHPFRLQRAETLDKAAKGCACQPETCHLSLSPLVAHPDEVFLVLLFDAEQDLIRFEALCEPINDTTVSQAEWLINEVVKRALQANAAFVTIAHYSPHFVGSPRPVDTCIARRLLGALEAVRLGLLDYLVVGKGHSVSLTD